MLRRLPRQVPLAALGRSLGRKMTDDEIDRAHGLASEVVGSELLPWEQDAIRDGCAMSAWMADYARLRPGITSEALAQAAADHYGIDCDRVLLRRARVAIDPFEGL